MFLLVTLPSVSQSVHYSYSSSCCCCVSILSTVCSVHFFSSFLVLPRTSTLHPPPLPPPKNNKITRISCCKAVVILFILKPITLPSAFPSRNYLSAFIIAFIIISIFKLHPLHCCAFHQLPHLQTHGTLIKLNILIPSLCSCSLGWYL